LAVTSLQLLTDALAQRSVNRSSTQQKRFHPHSIYVFEPATLGFPAVGDNRISLPVQARSGYWLGSAATYPLLTAAIDASRARGQADDRLGALDLRGRALPTSVLTRDGVLARWAPNQD